MPNFNNNDLFKGYQSQMDIIRANSAHDFHIIEFEQMCKDMIAAALQAHDEQVEIDVQTTLNGRPCTMAGLVNDIKQQITSALQKAFRR